MENGTGARHEEHLLVMTSLKDAPHFVHRQAFPVGIGGEELIRSARQRGREGSGARDQSQRRGGDDGVVSCSTHQAPGCEGDALGERLACRWRLGVRRRGDARPRPRGEARALAARALIWGLLPRMARIVALSGIPSPKIAKNKGSRLRAFICFVQQ